MILHYKSYSVYVTVFSYTNTKLDYTFFLHLSSWQFISNFWMFYI